MERVLAIIGGLVVGFFILYGIILVSENINERLKERRRRKNLVIYWTERSGEPMVGVSSLKGYCRVCKLSDHLNNNESNDFIPFRQMPLRKFTLHKYIILNNNSSKTIP